MLDGGGLPGFGDQLIDVGEVPEVLPEVRYVGNHEDAEAAGWGWRDSDADWVKPIFKGQNGYAKLEFDRFTGELMEVELHDTDRFTSFGLDVQRGWTPGSGHQWVAGDGLVEVGQVTSDGPTDVYTLNTLNLSEVAWTGSGIDVDGAVRYLRLGDVADDVDIHLGGWAKSRLHMYAGHVGEGVDLTFGGQLRYMTVQGWDSGSVSVTSAAMIWSNGDFGADVTSIARTDYIRVHGDFTGSVDVGGDVCSLRVIGGDLTGSVHVGGDLDSIGVTGGNMDASVYVGGRTGYVSAYHHRIGGTFDLAEGAEMFLAGEIALDSLAVHDGGIHLKAVSTDGSGSISIAQPASVVGDTVINAGGGSVYLSSLKVDGDLTIEARRPDGIWGDFPGSVNVIVNGGLHVNGELDVKAVGGNVYIGEVVAQGDTDLHAYAPQLAVNPSGCVTIGHLKVRGRLRCSSTGGNVRIKHAKVDNLGTRSTSISALSRAVAWGDTNSAFPTGNVTVGLSVKGCTWLNVFANGGDLRFTDRLVADVTAGVGQAWIAASEPLVGSTGYGGNVTFDRGGRVRVGDTLHLSARGGDITLRRTLAVKGDAQVEASSSSVDGRGGRLISSRWGGLHVEGLLESLAVDHLRASVYADSLGEAILRKDNVGSHPRAGSQGRLFVRDHSGTVEALNGTFDMDAPGINGLIYALSA